jgi:hypothetical protein
MFAVADGHFPLCCFALVPAAQCIICAVRFIVTSYHTCRDLKPENLLMTGRDDSSADLKLVDFGFAAKVHYAVFTPSLWCAGCLLRGVAEAPSCACAGGGVLTDEPMRDAGLRRAGDHSQAGPRSVLPSSLSAACVVDKF